MKAKGLTVAAYRKQPNKSKNTYLVDIGHTKVTLEDIADEIEKYNHNREAKALRELARKHENVIYVGGRD